MELIIITAIIAIMIMIILIPINIKKMNKIATNKELNEISKKYPDNTEICKEILLKLENKRTKIEENKDSESVSKFFLELKRRLGYEKFHILFPIILTDNGVEFSKPDVIEYNGNHVYKTKLFYCDPGASNQKGKLENNHEYIRRFIEKGNSFDLFNQDDINLMINHINSVKRDSLDGDNPYTLMIEFLPQEIIDLFDIEEIEQNKIILKKSLFKYKKKDS